LIFDANCISQQDGKIWPFEHYGIVPGHGFIMLKEWARNAD
jgi:hypothetical protein